MTGRGAALSVLLVLTVNAQTVHAQNCAPMAGAPTELGEIPAADRLAFLRHALAVDAHNMMWWSGIFGTTYLASTAYSLGKGIASHSRGERIDDYVGVAASFIGLGLIVVTPKKVLIDHPRFERQIARAGAGADNAETCRLVKEGERLLLRDADDERFGTGRLTQAGNFAFNMGVGLLLVGFGRYKQALIQTFAGIGVGELMIISQPIGAIKALGSYRDGALGRLDLAPSKPRLPLSLRVVPELTSRSAGLSVGFSF